MGEDGGRLSELFLFFFLPEGMHPRDCWLDDERTTRQETITTILGVFGIFVFYFMGGEKTMNMRMQIKTTM